MLLSSTYKRLPSVNFIICKQVMFVILRRTRKLYKGFKVILEDRTPEKIEWRRFNGFKIVDDTDERRRQKQFDIEKTEKRKGDGFPTAQTKSKKLV